MVAQLTVERNTLELELQSQISKNKGLQAKREEETANYEAQLRESHGNLNRALADCEHERNEKVGLNQNLDAYKKRLEAILLGFSCTLPAHSVRPARQFCPLRQPTHSARHHIDISFRYLFI